MTVNKHGFYSSRSCTSRKEQSVDHWTIGDDSVLIIDEQFLDVLELIISYGVIISVIISVTAFLFYLVRYCGCLLQRGS